MTALMLFGDTERSAALRHEVPIAIGDPLLWIELDGRTVILTSMLERDRIARALPDAEILDFVAFGLRDLRRAGYSDHDAERELVARVVSHLGIAETIVPGSFPVGVADRLRADDVSVTIDDEGIDARRRSKGGPELDGIRGAQRAAEAGMAAAEAMLAQAMPGTDRRLYLGGEVLEAERVRTALRQACAQAGAPCPPDVTVASVWTGFGHDPGSGPLPAGLPIQVDLWPRDEATACWADMTRTFIVGDPSPEHAELIREQQLLVEAALNDAITSTKPGVTGRELYDATCDRFEAAGYRTQRTGAGEDPGEGFQFSLGHGVGLEVHEAPLLGLGGRDPLVPGDVLAMEPGLWDRRIGGVRFEDLVLVTDDGYELLTDYPYKLTPGS
ncbi:MAG TPA: M24 family metallopeptidase [Solirubrobacteraceae bacterium]